MEQKVAKKKQIQIARWNGKWWETFKLRDGTKIGKRKKSKLRDTTKIGNAYMEEAKT